MVSCLLYYKVSGGSSITFNAVAQVVRLGLAIQDDWEYWSYFTQLSAALYIDSRQPLSLAALRGGGQV